MANYKSFPSFQKSKEPEIQIGFEEYDEEEKVAENDPDGPKDSARRLVGDAPPRKAKKGKGKKKLKTRPPQHKHSQMLREMEL